MFNSGEKTPEMSQQENIGRHWTPSGSVGGSLRPSTSESQLHVKETVARINAALKREQEQLQQRSFSFRDDRENPFKAMLQSSRMPEDERSLRPLESQTRSHSSLGWYQTLPNSQPKNSTQFIPVRSASCLGGRLGGAVSESQGGAGRTKRSQSLEPDLVRGRPPPAYRPNQFSSGGGGPSRSSSSEPEANARGFFSGGRPPSLSPTKPNQYATWREEDTPRGQAEQRRYGKYGNSPSSYIRRMNLSTKLIVISTQ
jgi:hypothetical protein